jgi:hypothetical protein
LIHFFLNYNIIIFQSLNDVNVADAILSRVVGMNVWWCCEEKAYLEQLSEHLIAHGHVGGCMYVFLQPQSWLPKFSCLQHF